MYKSLDLFQTAIAMARHAGAAQATVAHNIANADTPGFRAKQVTSFRATFETGNNTPLRTTRPRHLTGHSVMQSSNSPLASNNEPSPNRNTVSLEQELLNAVSVSREHNQALAIYRHAMTVLRTSLGK
ncbi:FlgB family protein [Yoonia sp.]|uniref:FlgB family protein n=1 Tax=Yoonia sp. TaxID=2212373 RepID=UPI0019FB4CD5|nr:FlgB family protein [Yoonia sp.]MBE0413777.1 FlgB family protein [Yoonia sp.]